MTDSQAVPLIIGELFVDVSIMPQGVENKLRLGGIAHAARALWALEQQYAVAAYLPEYLTDTAEAYLRRFGCVEFINLGAVRGAPNVIVNFDIAEIGDQQYEDLLRDEKTIHPSEGLTRERFAKFKDVLVLPGAFDLISVVQLLPSDAKLIVDAAYDADVEKLASLSLKADTVILSTSSPLFRAHFVQGLRDLLDAFKDTFASTFILKENRGGCRIYTRADDTIVSIPAYLGETVNSIGVGDAFDSAYMHFLTAGRQEAAWRGAQVASAYSQTTEPDLFKEYVRRDLAVSIDELKALGGVSVPWEARGRFQIYLAAPDFINAERGAIDRALESLSYHNFRVRRPVKENGELPPGSGWSTLNATYHEDIRLLDECDLVFAIPTGKDPGTLIEIGIAIAEKKPVIVYDPMGECSNTMVIAGSTVYSRSLDECLNAVFAALSKYERSGS